jgi:hypothetical protein
MEAEPQWNNHFPKIPLTTFYQLHTESTIAGLSLLIDLIVQVIRVLADRRRLFAAVLNALRKRFPKFLPI